MKRKHYNALNLQLLDALPLTSSGVPIIHRTNYVPQRIIPFNHIFTVRCTDCGVHFFLHDYQFERFWNEPLRYLPRLSDFSCIFAPDFSLYVDMPEPAKRWNIYRNRLLGAWLQANGLTVVPTISWAEPASFHYCFDGIEPHGTVAISTVGTGRNELSQLLWKRGAAKMMELLEPTTVIIYGRNHFNFDFGTTKIVTFENEIINRLRTHGR